ncbi:MAG TPA: hypothetical protein DCL44_09815 [Elusimicrobia bacterium]|nr:hypothetical protein [Elusimicrobiota bacterium]
MTYPTALLAVLILPAHALDTTLPKAPEIAVTQGGTQDQALYTCLHRKDDAQGDRVEAACDGAECAQAQKESGVSASRAMTCLKRYSYLRKGVEVGRCGTKVCPQGQRCKTTETKGKRDYACVPDETEKAASKKDSKQALPPLKEENPAASRERAPKFEDPTPQPAQTPAEQTPQLLR